MFLLPPVHLVSPNDIERALHIERVLGDIVLGLCYVWYVVGVGQLSVRSRPHALLALFIASIHMSPIWEMKRLNAASDHHPWGAWEQSSTLVSLFILFIGVPMFANWLVADRVPGWRPRMAPPESKSE